MNPSLFFGISMVAFGLSPGFLFNNQLPETYSDVVLEEISQNKLQQEAYIKDINEDYVLVEFENLEAEIELKDNFSAYLNPKTEKQKYLKQRANDYEGDCPEIKGEELDQFNIRKIGLEEVNKQKAELFFTFDNKKFVVTHLIIEI